MDFETISRRESRKRRRLSERRRLFSNRLGLQPELQMSLTTATNNSALDNGADCRKLARSDSPTASLGDQQRVSMKIQFHITVAPDNEPLILDSHSLLTSSDSKQIKSPPAPPAPPSAAATRSSSIGEQIQEKLNLSRQNSASSNTTNNSTRRRQQRLLDMHHSTNTTTSSGVGSSTDTPICQTIDDQLSAVDDLVARSDDNLTSRRRDSQQVSAGNGPGDKLPPVGAPFGDKSLGREAGARSSTITGGMADEATVRFLQRTGNHHLITASGGLSNSQILGSRPQRYSSATNLSTVGDREHIYFKRDGQRFGHEFTLKLAVDRTYRCLLKVRPLIPLQSISIQGHQLLFIDCSQQSTGGGGGGGSAPSSTANSTVALNQRLRSGSTVLAAVPSRHSSQPVNDAYLNKHLHRRNHHHHNHHDHHSHHNSSSNNHHQHHHRANHLRSHPISSNVYPSRPGLYHAQTTGSLYRASLDHQPAPKLLGQSAQSATIYREQQNQMMRHFAASYCSSSNSHLGNQLIYMFDWPASRFEVNKNKDRTQIQTVLKFKNGQILSLPLQVKFYQSDCRQHLEWGSQLHFIDYDCQIDQLGQISVERIQYY